MRSASILLLIPIAALAIERGAYDSNGRLIALLSDREDLEVTTNLHAVLPSGKRIALLTRRDDRHVAREGNSLAWSSTFQLPDGGRAKYTLKADESGGAVRYTTSITAESQLNLSAFEFTVDLPRSEGQLQLGNTSPIALSLRKSNLAPVEAATATFTTADFTLALAFDKTARVTLADRWDNLGRSYQLRINMHAGEWAAGTAESQAVTFKLTLNPATVAPVRITLDPSRVRHRFDGFGGNYCWNNRSPISAYTLDNLKVAWARTEMKTQQWDRERDHPGDEIRADMETMRKFQQRGIPYVISIWWLPERFYTDPYEKPRSAHFRLIDPGKWDALLDLISSYLLFAKREYGVEPDLFSFNEANIGIYVGHTPEAHTEVLKRFGAHFAKLGLKTKMLLGDATGPRDTHRFVLDAAADPEALQYAGAIGFHSWGGGTPEQYAAWGDVAEWLGLPLLVTELGVDAAAYNTRSWDSYQYGLREARMTQELLIHARPQGTQFWQFTNDYALARIGPDGKVQPTSRFYLMKHFTDLTPLHSEAIAAESSAKSVLVTAFRKDAALAIHILNLGPARRVELTGLSDGGAFTVTKTTETQQFVSSSAGAWPLQLELPARSLVTLTR